jgi:hypothetical protein
LKKELKLKAKETIPNIKSIFKTIIKNSLKWFNISLLASLLATPLGKLTAPLGKVLSVYMDGWEGKRINMVENADFRWPYKGQIMETTYPSVLLGMQSLHNKTLSHTPLVPLSFCKNSIVFILRWLPMYVSCDILILWKKSAILCMS